MSNKYEKLTFDEIKELLKDNPEDEELLEMKANRKEILSKLSEAGVFERNHQKYYRSNK